MKRQRLFRFMGHDWGNVKESSMEKVVEKTVAKQKLRKSECLFCYRDPNCGEFCSCEKGKVIHPD